MITGTLIVKIICSLFWAILFLQSGLDKIMDYQGNLSWLKSHFGNTFLKNIVSPMLILLTVAELTAGGLCAFGAAMLLLTKRAEYTQWGIIMCLVSFLMLLFGQRIAKDYAGAATIAIYFAGALISYSVMLL